MSCLHSLVQKQLSTVPVHLGFCFYGSSLDRSAYGSVDLERCLRVTNAVYIPEEPSLPVEVILTCNSLQESAACFRTVSVFTIYIKTGRTSHTVTNGDHK